MSVITPLNFSKAPLKITKEGETHFVWCNIRKKKLILTPEEWVRQHVIHFLITEIAIPIGSIASELTITVNNLVRRCDIVVFDAFGSPKMIVECKAPEIPITENVFYQIAQYNRKLDVLFLMMTNGINHFCCEIDKKSGELTYLDLNELKSSI